MTARAVQAGTSVVREETQPRQAGTPAVREGVGECRRGRLRSAKDGVEVIYDVGRL